jgi:predicted nuclease of restriction endonuclease-like (RecB) superfamily
VLPRNAEEKNLRRMIQFAEVFPGGRIVVSLSRELRRSHFLSLLPLKAPLRREFYAEMWRAERWRVRALRHKIGGTLCERTALSRKPAEVARLELAALRDEDRLWTDMVLRGPRLLDFLGLKDTFQQKDLEAAILREMERFSMELGSGFAFLARQKRITLDGEDLCMDLLSYQRELRRLVVVELEFDRFRAEHKGQMERYLRWLDKYERKVGEKPPIRIILCTAKDRAASNCWSSTRPASAWPGTSPPYPKDVLQRKLQEDCGRCLMRTHRGQERHPQMSAVAREA